MLKLSIMSEEELTHIFGNLDAYIPLHEDLLAQLSKATGPDGTVGQIGQIVVSWVSFDSTTPLFDSVETCLERAIFRVSIFPYSCQGLTPTRTTAATSWQPRLSWTRRNRTHVYRTSCSAAWSHPSAESLTCGPSWMSHALAWSSTRFCSKRS